MTRIVVALGGNALLPRSEMQSGSDRDPPPEGRNRGATRLENVGAAADILASLARHELVVTHGNGPQVGLLALQAEAAGSGETLDVLGAESEGMIGYVLAREIRSRVSSPPVVTLLTQVEVDPDDPAFEAPSKPIGPLYDRDTAERLAQERGWSVAKDGERWWRRVVPSPRPRTILELDAIRVLVDAGYMVVCGGGGGIPVMVDGDGDYVGVEGVVDKDRVSALMATELGADVLLLLTDEDAVYEDWPHRTRPLGHLTPERIGTMDLPAGSMGPKAEAAAAFAEAGGVAVIGALEHAADMLAGTSGTRVEAGGGSC